MVQGVVLSKIPVHKGPLELKIMRNSAIFGHFSNPLFFLVLLQIWGIKQLKIKW